jgi:hypothetical protein
MHSPKRMAGSLSKPGERRPPRSPQIDSLGPPSDGEKMPSDDKAGEEWPDDTPDDKAGEHRADEDGEERPGAEEELRSACTFAGHGPGDEKAEVAGRDTNVCGAIIALNSPAAAAATAESLSRGD